MKKILIFLIAFLMISTVAAVDSSNWNEINVKGHDFKIPPKYENGGYLDASYSKGSFTILCVDNMLVGNYGFVAKKATTNEDLTINGHPSKYIQYNKKYSRIYFATGDSIFSISWQGTEITPEIEEIIATSANSQISQSKFINILNNADNEYKQIQSNTHYNMEPCDDVEDYDEFAAYDDIGEAKFTINAKFFHIT